MTLFLSYSLLHMFRLAEYIILCWAVFHTQIQKFERKRNILLVKRWTFHKMYFVYLKYKSICVKGIDNFLPISLHIWYKLKCYYYCREQNWKFSFFPYNHLIIFYALTIICFIRLRTLLSITNIRIYTNEIKSCYCN